MNDTPRPAGDRIRQEAIDRLAEAFAQDALAVDEFERRVELVHEAESASELREILADLPSSAPPPAPVPSGETRPAPRPSPAPYPALEGLHVPENALIMGALGGAVRRGRWVPARRTKAIGILGGVELDFREAMLPPGVTEVQCFAFWGGVEIVVPPNVSVECDGIGILGGFEQKHEAPLLTDPDAPVIRIRGVAIMGGVEVSARYAHESPKDARRRLKQERREARRLRRGD